MARITIKLAFFATLATTLLSLGASAETPLRIAYGSGPSGRNNPHDSASITRLWYYAATYDALTYITRDGKLEPWLALEWTRETPTTWLFRLRPNVVFSNGQPLTPQDVINNVMYLTGPGKTEPVAGYVNGVSKAEAADDLTIRFTTARPDPMLPRKLSLIRIAALPKGQAFTHDALVTNAIGTGPYKVDTWQTASMQFSAAPNAWRRAPTQKLEAISAPDPINRRNALTTKRVDLAMAAFEPFEAADKTLPYTVNVEQLPAVVGMAYNTVREGPLKDLRVRKAIELAVNREQIIGALFSGLAKQATQPARREFFGFDDTLTPAPYDPARAKALLAEAGYKNGFKMTMTLTSGATVWDQIFQAVAGDLRKVGINLVIEMAPEQTVANYHYSQGYPSDAFGATYFSPSFDALDVMRQHSCTWPVAWHCDQDATRMIERAQNEPDLKVREDLTRDIMRRTRDTAMGMFMYESIGFTGYNRRISNFQSDFHFIRYELMKVAEE